MANRYIEKRGDKYVIIQKGTRKVLSRHDTKAKAQASFRALEASKHGVVLRNRSWRSRW